MILTITTCYILYSFHLRILLFNHLLDVNLELFLSQIIKNQRNCCISVLIKSNSIYLAQWSRAGVGILLADKGHFHLQNVHSPQRRGRKVVGC